MEGWTVAPVGSMTWRGRASSNILLSTARLNRIIEHEPADLIAIAESGVRLKTFNETPCHRTVSGYLSIRRTMDVQHSEA